MIRKTLLAVMALIVVFCACNKQIESKEIIENGRKTEILLDRVDNSVKEYKQESRKVESEPVEEQLGNYLICTGLIESDNTGGSEEQIEEEELQLTYLGEWITTGYCPCEECCGVWATGCTASGKLATSNHTVACGILPFETQIVIDGIIYTVEDTGVEGEWIDVFFDTHEEALAYGMHERSVYLVEGGD